MTLDEVRELIRAEVTAVGNQAEAARKWGISTQYLNDVLYNRRQPGQKILRAVGIRKTVCYEKEAEE